MKILYFLILLTLSSVAKDFYDIQFVDSGGKQIIMNSFKGKKIMIVVINAKSPDISYLRFLNILQRKSSTYQIIAVPSTEFSGLSNPDNLNLVKSSENLSIIIARASEVKKSSKSRQHSLLAWLTDKEQNHHFDQDVDVTEKMFFVSETGILYGILDKTSSPEVIANTLKQVVR